MKLIQGFKAGQGHWNMPGITEIYCFRPWWAAVSGLCEPSAVGAEQAYSVSLRTTVQSFDFTVFMHMWLLHCFRSMHLIPTNSPWTSSQTNSIAIVCVSVCVFVVYLYVSGQVRIISTLASPGVSLFSSSLSCFAPDYSSSGVIQLKQVETSWIKFKLKQFCLQPPCVQLNLYHLWMNVCFLK